MASQDPAAILQQLQQVVRAAYHNVQNQQERRSAETALIEFKRSGLPLSTLQEVLSGATDPVAQFHLAQAIRYSLARYWNDIPLPDRVGLMDGILNFCLQHAEPLFLRKALLGVVSFMVKRTRLQGDRAASELNNHFARQVHELLKREETQMRALGHELLCQAIAEYATIPPAIEMSHREHMRMALAFERSHLVTYSRLSLEAVLQQLKSPQAPGAAEVEHALLLVQQLLEWEFRAELPGKFYVPSLALHLGTDWIAHVVDPGLILEFLRLVFAPAASSDRLRHIVNRCLVALCQIQGKVLGDTPSTRKHNAVLFETLGGLLHRLTNVHDGGSGSDALALADAIAGSVHRLERSEPETRTTFFEMAWRASHRVAELDALEEGESLFAEANVALLGFWTKVTKLETPGVTVPQNYITQVFDSFVRVRLLRAIRELDSDDESVAEADLDSDNDAEDFVVLARLARLVPTHALNRLSELAVNSLHQWRSQSQTTAVSPEVFEELTWLVLFLGHVLADDAPSNGNRGVIPAELNRASGESPGGEQDPVLRATTVLMELVNFENELLQSGRQMALSATLSEAIVWALTRWTSSYLMVTDDMVNVRQMYTRPGQSPQAPVQLSPHLRAHLQGEAVKDTLGKLLEKVAVNVRAWAAEPAVMRQTCKFLKAIADVRAARPIILQGTLFWELVKVCCTPALTSAGTFPPNAGRRLSCALGFMGSVSDPNFRAMFDKSFLEPLRTSCVQLVETPVAVREQQASAYSTKLQYHIEMLRGLVQATTAHTTESISQCYGPFLPAITHFIKWDACHEAAVTSILKLVRDIIDFQFMFLRPEQCHELAQFAIDVIKVYMTARAAARPAATGAADAEARTERLSIDLRSVIQMIVSLVMSDLLQARNDGFVSRNVYAGLEMVIPCVTADLLALPKFSDLYFSTIATIVEVDPASLSTQAAPPQFLALCQSLAMGCSAPATTLTYSSFKAVRNMCEHQLKSLKNGGANSFAAQLQGAPDSFMILYERILARFMAGMVPQNIWESAKSALLALMMCSETRVNEANARVLEMCKDPESRHVLMGAFNNLPEGVGSELSSEADATFGRNLKEFCSQAQVCLDLSRLLEKVASS